ncbi:hypothetical protein [Streptomyces sp. NPDC060022]|uniref:hypothetical protein n=1 Tax=Streptomyces sp. NPDC060022 TaxID=3347039 RepID=UPI0036C62A20
MTEHTRPQIYGSDHDGADVHATHPDHEYVQLTGGPLGGQLLDVTGLTADERTAGAYLITPHSADGPGGLCLCADHSPARRSNTWRSPLLTLLVRPEVPGGDSPGAPGPAGALRCRLWGARGRRARAARTAERAARQEPTGLLSPPLTSYMPAP